MHTCSLRASDKGDDCCFRYLGTFRVIVCLESYLLGKHKLQFWWIFQMENKKMKNIPREQISSRNLQQSVEANITGNLVTGLRRPEAFVFSGGDQACHWRHRMMSILRSSTKVFICISNCLWPIIMGLCLPWIQSSNILFPKDSEEWGLHLWFGGASKGRHPKITPALRSLHALPQEQKGEPALTKQLIQEQLEVKQLDGKRAEEFQSPLKVKLRPWYTSRVIVKICVGWKL